MASKEPLISIVVPIYNVAEYLPRCLDSILAQTYKNFEVILVNDGSTDKSKQICQDYSRKDKRFILINKKNGGVSSARNTGIDRAKGDYVTFVDPDDYADDDYLEVLFRTMKRHGADISACGHITRYEASGATISSACGKQRVLTPEEAIRAMLYETYDGLGVSLWAKLFSKNVFDGVRFPEGRIFEDTAIVFELIGAAKSISTDLHSKYNYMMRSDSITNCDFDKSKLDMLDATKYACEKAVEQFPSLRQAAKSRMVYAYLSTLSQASKSTIRPGKKTTKALIKYVRRYGLPLLFNKNVKSRNKIGIITTLFGFRFYCFSWGVYSKVTGRKI